MPESQASLLTMQSRRLLLSRNGDRVGGYCLLGGDFFQKQNAFSEQMTAWRQEDAKKSGIFVPKRHDTSKQLWRNIPSIMAVDGGRHLPGVVAWLQRLAKEGLIPHKQLRVQAAAVKYGDKDFFVEDIWGDEYALDSTFFTEMGDAWIALATALLATTEKTVYTLGHFASDLSIAAGNDDSADGKRAKAMEEAFDQLDGEFRSWLSTLKPATGDMAEADRQWRDRLWSVLTAMAEELIAESGENAFVGRTVKNRITQVEETFRAHKLYVRLKASLHKEIYQ
jgi:CRISPR system Cascade subunit CasA